MRPPDDTNDGSLPPVNQQQPVLTSDDAPTPDNRWGQWGARLRSRRFMAWVVGIVSLVLAVIAVLVFQPQSEEVSAPVTIEEASPEAPPPPPEAAPPPAATAPAPVVHTVTVAKGDTLWEIASRECAGNPHRWPEIERRNEVNHRNLQIGKELTLPDDCQGATPVAATPPQLTKVEVPNDTLWEIAAKSCGNPYRWPEIRTLNGNVDPHMLKIDQVLTLPSHCQGDYQLVPVTPTPTATVTVTSQPIGTEFPAGFPVQVTAPCGSTVEISCTAAVPEGG